MVRSSFLMFKSSWSKNQSRETFKANDLEPRNTVLRKVGEVGQTRWLPVKIPPSWALVRVLSGGGSWKGGAHGQMYHLEQTVVPECKDKAWTLALCPQMLDSWARALMLSSSWLPNEVNSDVGQMAQWLRVFSALPEDLNSVLSTYTAWLIVTRSSGSTHTNIHTRILSHTNIKWSVSSRT